MAFIKFPYTLQTLASISGARFHQNCSLILEDLLCVVLVCYKVLHTATQKFQVSSFKGVQINWYVTVSVSKTNTVHFSSIKPTEIH